MAESGGAVLIVGAGPRLGAALARALATVPLDGGSAAATASGSPDIPLHGTTAAHRPLGLIGRSLNRTVGIAESLRAEGHSVAAEAADVADPDALMAAITLLGEQVGPFDIAVHNVSAWRDAGAATPTVLTADDLLADVAAGTASFITVVNAVAPAMMRRRSGTILVTGSGAADHPTPGAPSLAVQKAGLRILSLGLAAELAGQGVHIATVTIRGALDSPGRQIAGIASVYAELAAETAGPRQDWRREVDIAESA